MIDAIETRAKLDLRFRQALSHVWIAKEDATSFVGQRYIALGCTPGGAKHCAQPDGPALSSLLVRTGACRRLVRTLMSANGRFATLRLTALSRMWPLLPTQHSGATDTLRTIAHG